MPRIFAALRVVRVLDYTRLLVRHHIFTHGSIFLRKERAWWMQRDHMEPIERLART